MLPPFTTPVTVVNRTKKLDDQGKPVQDSMGNDVFIETPVAVDGIFAPGSSAELVQGQDVVTMQPSVYLPPGTNVTAIDAIDVGGERFEVDGSPNVWTNPFTGWQPGVEVKLRRVTG